MGVGSVLGAAFSIWFSNALPFIVLTVIAFAPYASFWYYARYVDPSVLQADWYELVEQVIQTICASMLSAASIHTVFNQIRGKRVSFSESLSRGLSKLPAVIGVAILSAIVLFLAALPALLIAALAGESLLWLAALLSIVTIMVVSCGIFVAVAVCVVERVGPVAALQRSWSLTSGYKGVIFAILFMFWILMMVASSILIGAGAALSGGELMDGSSTVLIGVLIVSLFLGSIQAVLTAVVYHDLRRSKEGIGADDIADVFA